MSTEIKGNTIEDHPIMNRYINYYKKTKEISYLNHYTASNIIFSIIIAPFYTISISRQLSVIPHKEIYGDYINPKTSKELTKISTEITLREAKNFELIKSSGVLEGQKPYRAPIYDNYWQTIKGLYRQGILGFYKGNFWRLLTVAVSQRARISFDWAMKEKFPTLNYFSFFRDWISLSLIDMVTHVGFIIENRYILQNRIPQFQFYKNIFKVNSRSYYELDKGISGHIPKNFIFLCGFYFYNLLSSGGDYTTGFIIGSICSYPILTAFRRIVCESTNIPGLLPLRYLNLLHAIFLIRREEGFFLGLYRGFFSYLIGILLWAFLVPNSAKFYYDMARLEEEQNLFVNDPVFEEIKKRKIQQNTNS